MHMVDQCSTCDYFSLRTVTDGYCRKNAPVAGHGFPLVPSDEWCGEHPEYIKKKEAKP